MTLLYNYNGEEVGGPAPIANTTINFFAMTSDGLSLFNVHDAPYTGNTDTASMAWNIAGDTASFLAGDDGGEGLSSGFGVEASSFTTRHTWLSCCTDGFALGSLDGGFELFGSFTNIGNTNGQPDLTTWSVLSNSGGNINLAMDLNRRVRFDAVSVPEPSSIALLGLGLLGLGVARRSQKKS